MFEDPNAPPASDPTSGGGGTGSGAKTIPDDTTGYSQTDLSDTTSESGATDSPPPTADGSDPTSGGGGTGGGV